MMLEDIVPALLNSLVDSRVWEGGTPSVLPRDVNGEIAPFILWSANGGRDSEYVDQTMGSMSNSRLQIQVVSPSGADASALLKQARDKLLAAAYPVSVLGSPISTNDAARRLRGRLQHFSIWFPQ